jgi:hypothetical protein
VAVGLPLLALPYRSLCLLYLGPFFAVFPPFCALGVSYYAKYHLLELEGGM